MSKFHYAASVAYDGSRYAGFQAQNPSSKLSSNPSSNLSSNPSSKLSSKKRKPPTIQEEIEKALSTLLKEPTRILYAGRTDAGVHARGQMISWRSGLVLVGEKLHKFIVSMNALLPRDIVCLQIYAVKKDFHPRFSCVARKYRYYIYNSMTPPIFGRPYVAWIKQELNLTRMQKNLNLVIGRHDFSSFIKLKSQPQKPFRTIYTANICKQGKLLTIEICSNGFFHHMIRNIVGTLLDLESCDGADFAQILTSRDRRKAGTTAPAHGLFLDQLDYPTECGAFGTSVSSLEKEQGKEKTPELEELAAQTELTELAELTELTAQGCE